MKSIVKDLIERHLIAIFCKIWNRTAQLSTTQKTYLNTQRGKTKYELRAKIKEEEKVREIQLTTADWLSCTRDLSRGAFSGKCQVGKE